MADQTPTPAECQAELTALEAKRDAIQHDREDWIIQLEGRRAMLEAVERDLDNVQWEIARARSKLEQAIRREADSALPPVVWQDGRIGPEVVTRITPRRVYYRTPGSIFEVHQSRGRGHHPWGIDIEATVARFKAATRQVSDG